MKKERKHHDGGVLTQSISSIATLPSFTTRNAHIQNKKARFVKSHGLSMNSNNQVRLGSNIPSNLKSIKMRSLQSNKSNLVNKLFEKANDFYNDHIYISSSPPKKPPNNDLVFVAMDCLDDDDIEKCCKLNDSFCKSEFSKTLFKQFLEIIKKVVNTVFEEFINSLNPSVYFSLDAQLIVKASLVSYTIDIVAESLLKNPDINEDFKEILILSLKTYIMLPSTEMTPYNMFIKIASKKINETLNLSKMNSVLSALATEELKKYSYLIQKNNLKNQLNIK